MQKSKCTNRIKITHQWKQKIEKQECVQKIWNPFMFSCVFLELLGYQPRVSISCWIENILRATGWKLKKKANHIRDRYCEMPLLQLHDLWRQVQKFNVPKSQHYLLRHSEKHRFICACTALHQLKTIIPSILKP